MSASSTESPVDTSPAPDDRSAEESVRVSVIIPTFREAGNLPFLIPRVSEVLTRAGYDAEILVVDDNSDDGTVEACEELKEEHPVRLFVRTKERGLSTAVIHGMRQATGTYLLCMDADLSHPPEALPALLSELQSGADFVIGSRYVSGGTTAEDWGVLRWLNSKIATLIARPLTTAKDPMAGFFGLPRSTFDGIEHLDPVGYKIGLELIVKGACDDVAEVPIHFATRLHGESKLTFREQLNYLRHVRKLLRYRYGAFAFLAEFLTISAVGIGLELLLLTLFLTWLPFPRARGLALGIAWPPMAVAHHALSFSRHPRRSGLWLPIAFIAGAGVALVVSLAAAPTSSPTMWLFLGASAVGSACGLVATLVLMRLGGRNRTHD